jgi:hypothetical protein
VVISGSTTNYTTTAYIIRLTSLGEVNFIRKNIAPLTGAEVNLLTDETVQKLICYAPP